MGELPLTEDLLDKFLQLPEGRCREQSYAAAWLAEARRRVSSEAADDPPSADERSDFLEHAVARYSSLVREALGKYDGRHMYLGFRLHGQALRLPAVFRGLAPHVDVVSANVYNVWSPA